MGESWKSGEAASTVHPLKAKGYPDQIFTGKLEDGKLSGVYSWVTSRNSKTGWKAVRTK